MNRSTKQRIAQLAIILGVLVFSSLCYLVAGWFELVVMLAFAFIIAGIIWGIFYVTKLFGDNRWLNVAIFSGWIGILVAVASFILMVIDPSHNFSLGYILKTTGIIGLVFLVGGFVATYINWNVIGALK